MRVRLTLAAITLIFFQVSPASAQFNSGNVCPYNHIPFAWWSWGAQSANQGHAQFVCSNGGTTFDYGTHVPYGGQKGIEDHCRFVHHG